MTVSYSREVATATLGTFLKLLFRWKGSLYQLLYREMIIFLFFYYLIYVVYHFIISESMQRKFEAWSLFCHKYTDIVPLTFVLGFYISIIIGRWWNIFLSLMWPDRMCLQIQSYIKGNDENARKLRRSSARYVNLANVLVLRDISSAVRKRFPTIDHLVDAGFMTAEEKIDFEAVEMSHHKFWLPLQWTCSIFTKARTDKLIDFDAGQVKMIEEVLKIRDQLVGLLCYDWISVPLVYTQVVAIALYSYFFACLFARQDLLSLPENYDMKHFEGHEMDMYFPLFTVFQFVFYVGWLKVAESIMNPLGEDDDDFEVNYLIERNLQVSYSIVDENYMKIPKLQKDMHWNEQEVNVPHTQASAGLKSNPPVLSATDVEVSAEDAEIHSCSTSMISLSSPNASRKSSKANRRRSSISQAIRRFVGEMPRKISSARPKRSTDGDLSRKISSVKSKLSNESVNDINAVENTNVLENNLLLTVPGRSTLDMPAPSRQHSFYDDSTKMETLTEVVEEDNISEPNLNAKIYKN